MAKPDIRFSGEAATLEHHSARGHITRNSGPFTRGSQLVTHEFRMVYAGIRIPFLIWLTTFVIAASAGLFLTMYTGEVSLVLMRLWASVWEFMGFSKSHVVDLTMPSGEIVKSSIDMVAPNPVVRWAWTRFMRCLFASFLSSVFIAAPLSIWFINFSRRRGRTIMDERHERGALLVKRSVLLSQVKRYNEKQLVKACANHLPPIEAKHLDALSPERRRAVDIHRPYSLAGIPYPWGLEQSHTMLIGTTGAGKTTQLRSLVAQLRRRGHRAVIFDLTGAFVEAFYDEQTDVIMNPMDTRCPPWTIFDECENYADFISAAEALIPSRPGDGEPFWPMAARTIFVETCIKLQEAGETSNAAIAHHLMTADLKHIHKVLEDTVAAPLTTEKAAKMAESIRAVFNTNGQALRFLPDVSEGGPKPFCIRNWIMGEKREGSILFVTSNHIDLSLNRALLTLWMNLAVNNLLRLPRTRELRTWFLFDEVHALHALPAIGNGLQTARGFGGAFVLGMHSFEKLVETYGEQGAVTLAGLARTKLILATADRKTAETCSEFIGNREVRQMDEAYSYGYNNTRDASTLTPRKTVEPLVFPDDITNLPSLHGFVKFPDGFPAARVRLKYRDYACVAEPFLRKTEMTPSPYVRPKKTGQGAEEEGGGPERAPETTTDVAKGEPSAPPEAEKTELSEAERAARAIEVKTPEITGAASPDQPAEGQPSPPSSENHPAKDGQAPSSGASDRLPAGIITSLITAPGSAGQPSGRGIDGQLGDMGNSRLTTSISRDQTEIARAQAVQKETDKVYGPHKPDRPEDQALRESREGAGTHERGDKSRDPGDPEPDLGDGFEMGD